MKKQPVACLLLAAILLFSTLSLCTVSGEQHCITGEDYGILDFMYLPGHPSPCYCECNHAVWEGDPGDSMAGLGIEAYYTLFGYPIPSPYFHAAYWYWVIQCGADSWHVNIVTGMDIDACVNGYQDNYYTDYTPPQWGYPPYPYGSSYECNYVYLEMSGEIGYLVNSVEGSTRGQFYSPNLPPPDYDFWYMEAYTQNPYDHPNGHGWSFIYAHW